MEGEDGGERGANNKKKIHVRADLTIHVDGQSRSRAIWTSIAHLNRSWTQKCIFKVHEPKQNRRTSLRTHSAFYSLIGLRYRADTHQLCISCVAVYGVAMFECSCIGTEQSVLQMARTASMQMRQLCQCWLTKLIAPFYFMELVGFKIILILNCAINCCDCV